MKFTYMNINLNNLFTEKSKNIILDYLLAIIYILFFHLKEKKKLNY